MNLSRKKETALGSASLHPLAASLAETLKDYPARPLYIAYSGGLDSSVLLHLSIVLKRKGLLDAPLSAWHINHHLQSQADDWEKHCRSYCQAEGIPLLVCSPAMKKRKGESTEMMARRERYAAWEGGLPPNALLLQAHHERDQVETLLLRMIRGSRNLNGMPKERQLGERGAALLRPFLELPQALLRAYQQENSIAHIEDPSNQEVHYDRNFIRRRILPLITARWPSAEKKIRESAQRLNLANSMLGNLKERLQKKYCRHNKLSIRALEELPLSQAEILIEAWLERLRLPAASPAMVREILRQVQGRRDANPQLRWQGAEVHRYGGFLYAMLPLPSPPAPETRFVIEEIKDSRLYEMPLGSLIVTPARGQGSTTAKMTVRFRQGGEKVLYHQQHHSLKKILQNGKIPPWLRNYIPLLYRGDLLVMMPDNIWMDEDFKRTRGIKAHWQLNPLYGNSEADDSGS